MKQRSIRLVRLVVLVVTAMIIVAPATAADQHTVVATVTALDGPCIAIGLVSGEIDFGALAFSTPGAEISAQSDQYGLDNCSTQTSEFSATGSGGFRASLLPDNLSYVWLLTTSEDDICSRPEGDYRMSVLATNEQFYSEANLGGGATPLLYPTSGDANPEFESTVAPGTGLSVINKITMPCIGSPGAGEDVVTFITYTATVVAPVTTP